MFEEDMEIEVVLIAVSPAEVFNVSLLIFIGC